MKTATKVKVLAYGSLGIIATWPLVALAAQALTMDTAVDQRLFTGDGDWDVGRTKAECAASSSNVAVTGVSTNPNNGVSHSILCTTVSPTANSHFVTVDYALGDNRRDGSTGDWDPGFTKGECAANERVVGMSEDPVFGQLSRLQCAGAGIARACHTVVFSNGDNRGTTATGDWAPGFFKGECAPGEIVKGVSKTFCGGSPHAILCCAQSFLL
jgi:hypothetical protein